MKLAICTPSYWPERNGVATVATELAARFGVMGHDVTVIAPRRADRTSPEKHCGITILPVATEGRGTLLSPYRGDIAGYRQVLHDLKADIYLFICWEHWLVDCATEAFRTIPGKKVLASHGTSALWRPPGLRGWVRRLLYVPHALRYARHLSNFDYFILSTGRAGAARFYDKRLIDERGWRNWAVIPNGGDVAMSAGSASAFRRRHHLEDRFVILSVGNFQWAKNQAALVFAFLRAQLRDSTLVLIGPEENRYARGLHRMYGDARKHDERVLLLTGQSREDLADAYSAADLFASASITEAQPLTILDAMASGTPFLSYNVGCVADLPGGVVVNDEGEFIAQMRSLADDRVRRKGLGAAGREACAEVFDWEKTAEAYHSVFQGLLAGTLTAAPNDHLGMQRFANER